MAITYVCRHCRSTIGSLNSELVTESMLGFQFLTPAERRDIIAYNPNGDVTVNVTCDYCREALQANPELNLLGSPLQ